MCEVDRRHDRSADTEHQSHACIDEEQRRRDIDCRQRVAADAAADENAVRDDERRRENHSQNGRDQQFAEQPRNLHAAEVDTVFHDFVFWECKDNASRTECNPYS